MNRHFQYPDIPQTPADLKIRYSPNFLTDLRFTIVDQHLLSIHFFTVLQGHHFFLSAIFLSEFAVDKEYSTNLNVKLYNPYAIYYLITMKHMEF